MKKGDPVKILMILIFLMKKRKTQMMKINILIKRMMMKVKRSQILTPNQKLALVKCKISIFFKLNLNDHSRSIEHDN